MTLAQVVQRPFAERFGNPATWSIGEFLIAVLVIAAAVAIFYIALQKFGIQIPDWIVRIFWIIVVLFVAVWAIRFVFGI